VTTIISFGEWVQKRRNQLGISRTVLARQVGCAPITIKKIERDERRPSVQIAELLAEHLQVPEQDQKPFLRMARGEFVERMTAPHEIGDEDSDVDQLKAPKPQKPDRFRVLGRLGALPDQKLFGVDTTRTRVIEAVAQVERPWLVSLEGLGGIGKTSLANEIVHHFVELDRFADIGWISAKQEEYVTGRGVQPVVPAAPALDVDVLVDLLLVQLSVGPYPIQSQEAKRAALIELVKEKPCLIVIDNLESVEDYLALLPLLRILAQPSKFLITSRMSLQNEGDVYSQSLRELSEEDSLQFLRYEAELQRVRPLMGASADELKMIYEAVGGNPLALKLVIGQAHLLPLNFILKNLRQAKESQVDQLYEYIYWQAWQMLDENGRRLLLSLPIVPNGTFEQIMVASQLEPFELQSALSHLRQLSLIEVGGEFSEPRYRLHRLTESFLMNEVVHWQTTLQQQAKREQQTSAEELFFHDRVQGMVKHWQADEALQKSEIEMLDREKEGILKTLHLGLAIEGYWPIIKPLIFSLTSYMERRGHWQAWQQTLETAIHMAQQVNDQEGEIKLLGVLGRVLQRQNLGNKVIQNYRHVIQLARQTQNREEEARACSNLGFALIAKEQFWRSEVYSRHALELFSELKHQHGLAHTHNHLGFLYLKNRAWDRAEAEFQSAYEIWQEAKDLSGMQFVLMNLGYLNNEKDQPQKATPYLEQALQIAENIGDRGMQASAYLNLAISYERLSDVEKALSYVYQSEALFEIQGNHMDLCTSWEIMGKIQSHDQQWETALDYYESALDGFLSLQNTEGQVRVESRKLSLFVNSGQWELADQTVVAIKSFGEENTTLEKNQYVVEALSEYEDFRKSRLG
jgi:transcriptional regulator with XRE-family HTH domain/tetratricopeptide (TPR) repeat protein